jgi:hypothetical protein
MTQIADANDRLVQTALTISEPSEAALEGLLRLAQNTRTVSGSPGGGGGGGSLLGPTAGETQIVRTLNQGFQSLERTISTQGGQTQALLASISGGL